MLNARDDVLDLYFGMRHIGTQANVRSHCKSDAVGSESSLIGHVIFSGINKRLDDSGLPTNLALSLFRDSG